MSSLLLRKSAKGASPEYGQQVPSISKDFLRGGKDIFQAPDASIHLTHPQLYASSGKKQVVTADESPSLADIYGVKLTLTSRGCVGKEMTSDSPTREASAGASPLPASPFPVASGTIGLSQNILRSG